MKNAIKWGAVAVCNFAAGYTVAQWHMRNHYAALAEAEIQDARADYRAALAENERHVSVIQDIVENEEAEIVLASYQGDAVPHQPHDYTQYRKFEGATAGSTIMTIDPMAPVIVGEDEYMDSDHSEAMTWYTKDNTMTDEEETPLTKHARNHRLGELDGVLAMYADHENNVYVKSPRAGRIYQININPGSYREEVLGEVSEE